jgi:hypothetical protein
MSSVGLRKIAARARFAPHCLRAKNLVMRGVALLMLPLVLIAIIVWPRRFEPDP